jgi:hypothetical protein
VPATFQAMNDFAVPSLGDLSLARVCARGKFSRSTLTIGEEISCLRLATAEELEFSRFRGVFQKIPLTSFLDRA